MNRVMNVGIFNSREVFDEVQKQVLKADVLLQTYLSLLTVLGSAIFYLIRK